MEYLSNIPKGKIVKVECLFSRGLSRERMLALGLTRDTSIEVIRKGPSDNLTVYNIRGAMIALRKEEACLIGVSLI